MDAKDLTSAERRVYRAFPRGDEVDFRDGDDDPAAGASWGPGRTIRAKVLRTLLLREGADRGEIPALRVVGARVTGPLDLRDAVVAHPVRLRACYFDEAPNLYAARTRQLNLSESVFPDLVATEIQMEGALHLTDCRVLGTVRLVSARIMGALLLDGARLGSGKGEVLQLNPAHIEHDLWGPGLTAAGQVRLDGANIGGALNLQNAELTNPGEVCLRGVNLTIGSGIYGERLTSHGEIRLTGARIGGSFNVSNAALTNPRGPALTAPVITVGLDMLCVRMRAEGGVRFRGARIAGGMNLDDATLVDPGGAALQAENLAVGTDLQGMRLRADGRVDLRGAKIIGQLNLAYARLTNAGGMALRASGCTAAECWLRDAEPIVGSVNLRRAQFDLLHATPDLWPGSVKLDGLTYGRLAPHLPARERLELLERDEDGYVPHAYEQLAGAYSRIGDDAAARLVRLAKQRRHRSTLPSYAKVWGYLQDVTVGYGYRPMRAAAWLAVLLAIGTVTFGLHHPPPLEHGKAPGFNPFIYTLNLLLPIVDFGQAKAFNPQGPYQWLSYLLVAAGWILATTVLAGITRTINRQ